MRKDCFSFGLSSSARGLAVASVRAAAHASIRRNIVVAPVEAEVGDLEFRYRQTPHLHSAPGGAALRGGKFPTCLVREGKLETCRHGGHSATFSRRPRGTTKRSASSHTPC